MNRCRLMGSVVALSVFGSVNAAEPDVFLRCEGASKWERENQDWYISIDAMKIGGDVIVKQEYDTGSNTYIYEIYKVNDIIAAEMDLTQKKDTAHARVVTIDRKTGRVKLLEKYNPEDLEQAWNEEKQRVGGFEEPTWLASVLNCDKAEPVF